MNEVEEWRPVVGWEGQYEISSHGRVRSLDRIVTRHLKGRVLSPSVNHGGYKGVCLMGDGRRSTKSVHGLVAEAFIGLRPADMEVAHNDGDPSNCRSTNLRYATHAQNLADKVRHGTHAAGERHPCAKLSVDQVKHIRDCATSAGKLAIVMGVTRSTIGLIRRGKSWRDLAD